MGARVSTYTIRIGIFGVRFFNSLKDCSIYIRKPNHQAGRQVQLLRTATTKSVTI